MVLIRRQKGVIAALALYWPTLFVLAHIPIPRIVRQAHVSDKSLHLLAYLILTFLLWSAIRPLEPVRWRRAAVWCLLVFVAVYGVCDEGLQHFVGGRSVDPKDFAADMVGAVAALVILTVLPFWPASVTIAGATIYTLAVFTRANLMALLPVTMSAFHFATHAVFTLLWMGYVHQSLSPRRDGRLWWIVSISLPVTLVLVTKASAMISGKAFEGWDVVAALAGILAAVAVVSIAVTFRPRGGRAGASM